jgi:hypothetical protein
MEIDPRESTDDNDGWGKWGKHVIIELQRLNDNMEALRDKVGLIDKDTSADIRELKIRCGLYGGGGGVIVTLVVEGLALYFSHKP